MEPRQSDCDRNVPSTIATDVENLIAEYAISYGSAIAAAAATTQCQNPIQGNLQWLAKEADGPPHTTTQSMPVAENIEVRPTGRMSAYAFFIQSCKEEHEKNHPDEKEINFLEISKEWIEKWKNMDEKEKEKFQEMAK